MKQCVTWLVMMAMDLLNNITIGLNHGDFAENFIPFQKINPCSTCEIWMLLTLVIIIYVKR